MADSPEEKIQRLNWIIDENETWWRALDTLLDSGGGPDLFNDEMPAIYDRINQMLIEWREALHGAAKRERIALEMAEELIGELPYPQNLKGYARLAGRMKEAGLTIDPLGTRFEKLS